VFDSVVYLNVAGCDSTVYLDLTLNSSSIPTNQPIAIYACGGWTNPYNGVLYTETDPQVSVVVGPTSDGCDSLAYFEINIAPEKQWDTTVVACDSQAPQTQSKQNYHIHLKWDQQLQKLGDQFQYRVRHYMDLSNHHKHK
jgi:hypothetical protein